jgi:hypothetical protein
MSLSTSSKLLRAVVFQVAVISARDPPNYLPNVLPSNLRSVKAHRVNLRLSSYPSNSIVDIYLYSPVRIKY